MMTRFIISLKRLHLKYIQRECIEGVKSVAGSDGSVYFSVIQIGPDVDCKRCLDLKKRIRMVTYSLGLNVAVHPETAKSVHFHLFGEFRSPRLFDDRTNRLGAARITVEDDIENIENIARIHSLDNHYTFSGEPSKIMESVFFSPTWTPAYLKFLLGTGGWDPDDNPFQFVIDFSKNDAYENFISEISKSSRAILEGGRVFPETNEYAFISSHIVLIVDDLEEFEEQILDLPIKGERVQEDVVRRIEVNFNDPPNSLVIPYIHLGLLPLNCTVFESKPFFDMLENDPTNEHLDIVIFREILEKVKENRNQILQTPLFHHFQHLEVHQ